MAKHLAGLNAAAEHTGWGEPLSAGVHRGIAQFMGYGSCSAPVAEAWVSPLGELKVRCMVLKLNCGHAVNPGRCGAGLTKAGLFRPGLCPPRAACCAGG